MFKIGVWFTAAWFCGAPLYAQGGSRRSPEVKLIDSIQGKDLFKSYCASCHGLDARGKGPMAAVLLVPPSDLRRISIRNHDVFPMKGGKNHCRRGTACRWPWVERDAGMGTDFFARH